MIKNRQKKIYLVSLILALLFLAIILFSILSPDTMGEMMPPVFFMSVFLGISCLVVAIMFRKRSRLIEQAMDQKDYIVRWTFSPSEWERYINYEYAERMAMRKGAFIFLGILIVIIFTIFILCIDEAQLTMFFAMLGLLGILSFFAFILPWLAKITGKAKEAEVLILKEGILLDQQFHSWNYFSSDLISAEIAEKPFRHLELVYTFVSRNGKEAYPLFIPVPEGVDPTEVVVKLKKANDLNS
ncbi:MAG TPA: hypothetical protein PK466_03805 [Thermotogota bacterium]|nr:hypothetical protein [Thermotogota bacterium]HPR95428.1 hypothetical protein [Thermotogota bacterium]